MIAPNMGMKSTAKQPAGPAGLASVLFTPVQQRVLALLFGQPQRRFQSAELIRLADSGTGSVHRLLTRLAAAGLVRALRIGNQKHYQANADSPIFAELVGLVRKTVGLVEPLRSALAPLSGKIMSAFVYGSVAKRTDHADSDIDLMVIADDLEYGELYAALPAAEEALARTISPNLMNYAEWKRKCAEPDSFAARIAAQPRLFVLGSSDGLG
ncbi:MAG: nucleotidyltransferase domain-containing protein [Xanthomonadales bacterium]|nr:nucleotidyltransferase domain-containing protein [Xanthomonadales bacterium]